MSEGSKIAIGLQRYMESDKNDIFDFQMPEVPEPIQEKITKDKNSFTYSVDIDFEKEVVK